LIDLLDEFHEEVDSEFVLEDVLHVYYEGMIHIEEDLFFKFDVIELLIVNNNVFPNALHCIDLVVFGILNEEDFAKCAFANHLLNHEVLQTHIVLPPVEYHITSSLNTLSLLLLCISFFFIFVIIISKVFSSCELLISEFHISIIVITDLPGRITQLSRSIVRVIWDEIFLLDSQ
jgi:hypothetical protein